MKQLRSMIPADPTAKAALILLPILCLGRAEGLEMNAHYISRPAEAEDRAAWLAKIRAHRDEARAHLDRGTYDREETAWAARAFTCHFTFMYDRSFYDPAAGEYVLEKFIDEGRREFGGYDLLLLWQGYPRLGVDQRNQFDMYRDMPGGLDGLRSLVRRAHKLGVKVSIDYNPWDQGTRREPKSDEETLADLVASIEADGIFLDTMSAGSQALRKAVDAAKPGVVFAPEGHPGIDQLGICHASWAQWLQDNNPPGILHLKWIEPRHMQYQIRRWDRSHAAEIEAATFNGSGMLVWENIFGTYNPWPSEDRRLWRRSVAILRRFASQLTSDSWDPFYPTLAKGLHANRWPGEDATLFTLMNLADPIKDAPLIEVSKGSETLYYDLWNGLPLESEDRGDRVVLSGSVERLGALLCVSRGKLAVDDLLSLARGEAGAKEPRDARSSAASVVDAAPVQPTVLHAAPPPGMVLVPGGKVRMQLEHMRRECGCYPDPGIPESRWHEFLWGSPHDGRIKHDIGPLELKPFFIDEAEVSNVEFRRFLEASAYKPRHPENFLKHWPNGRMPPEIADHPVVHVDLEDARAYARWAGKRLPTEAEWHLAAQGTDGRTWPWGNEFDPARCTATGTVPVRSSPDGRSPYGCYHMSGNVWEWTESVRDDGHTRFAIIRGGSYFDASTSIWYVRGGPQPLTHHAKFILMWPGLDRCATIGFRCVADAAP